MSYGSVSPSVRRQSAATNAATVFVVFVVATAALGATLYFALPPLDDEDRPLLRIPRSFEQLQQLNMLLKKYRDIYPYRIVLSYVATYLFLQTFSLPGSMYLSILGGAVWGVARALPLACTCVATGASLCYLLSAALGPALLSLPRFKARLDSLARTIRNNKQNIFSFLIVLRIAPLPPHWVLNVVCPHVGIGLIPFWFSTWLGVFGVTVIHTTVGGGLDDMTSPADFRLISWRNFFGLSAVVVGVMIPVGLRYWFGRKVTDADVDRSEEESLLSSGMQPGDTVLAFGPGVQPRAKISVLEQDEDEDDLSESDDDDDIILDAGPAINLKYKDDSPEPRVGSSRSSSR